MARQDRSRMIPDYFRDELDDDAELDDDEDDFDDDDEGWDEDEDDPDEEADEENPNGFEGWEGAG